MRKVLSFVLVLALVLGSFSMAFAATPAGGFSDTDAEAVSVLADLDVIDGYPDGSFKPGNVVTRAEMAKLIIVALGLEDFATATTSKYSDMAGAGWAQGYVAYATSLGIIEGYPGGTFGPSNPVTYNEACAMIVRALGYTADFLPGGWPAEWVVKAQTLGILDGVSAAGASGATRGNIAEMLYNALELGIGYVDKDGNFAYNIPEDTMLIRLGAEFIAAEDADNDGIIYGDEDTMINLRPFVGAYADRYINEDEEIIKVVPVSTFLTGEYNEDDDLFEADNGIDYNIADAIAAPTTPEAIGFMNGEYEMNDASVEECDDMITGGAFTIAVDWSGKTIKKVYSVSTWMADTAFMFDDDYAEEIADDQELDTIDFILDDSDEIDLNEFELLGAADLDSIDEDNVVYVYAGETTGDIRRIEVGTETVTGKVTRISSDGCTITIGGKAYDIADIEEAIDCEDITLGETGTAYLDFDGNVFDFDVEDATADNYALVIDTDFVESSFDNSRIKLLTKDGTETIYDVNDDADITETTGLTTGALIVYSLDKDGDVDKIVQKTWSPDTQNGQLSASRAIYDGKVVADEVVVFTTNGDYDVVDLSTIETETDLNAHYYADPSKVEVLLVDADYADAGDMIYAVINDVSTAINDDDDDVYFVEGFANGKAFEAYTDSQMSVFTGYDAVDDGPGVWELEVDADGVIVDAMFYNTDDIDESGIDDFEAGDVTDRDGYLVELDDATWYAIDEDAVYYDFDYDASNPYSVKTITSLKDDAFAVLVQVDEDSEYFDLTLTLTNYFM